MNEPPNPGPSPAYNPQQGYAQPQPQQQPAPQQQHQQYAPAPMQQPNESAIVAKLKANLPLTIALFSFAFAIFWTWVGGAFDIEDVDVHRFLSANRVAAATTGVVSLLAGIYASTMSRDKPTFGLALLLIVVLMLAAGLTVGKL